MKLFKTFRLDTANDLLWRNGDRVAIAPKCFEMLAYLIEHAGRVVAQDEILEALWPETHVNPEVLRKYILEIRKALGDRPDNPEFIETVPSGDTGLLLP
jgi:DNA-binding winged helix-turn-helix (wHTH) protein